MTENQLHITLYGGLSNLTLLHEATLPAPLPRIVSWRGKNYEWLRGTEFPGRYEEIQATPLPDHHDSKHTPL